MKSAEKVSKNPAVIWVLAVLGSVMLHTLAAVIIFRIDFRPLPRPRQVVAVEPLTLTEGLPGRRGGGGGEAVPEKKPVVAPPSPAKSSKLLARRKPTPPPRTETPSPDLALPTPAKTPPPATTATAPPAPAASQQVIAGLPGRGSGTGSGFGSGSGTGSGVGPGTGTGTGGLGGGAGTALKEYLQQVRQLLDRHKHYPALARRQHLEGVAVLRFTIFADGRIENPQLKRSSGHTLLDEEAQETVRRVRSFPPFPPGIGRERLTIEIPLAFRLVSN